MRPGKFKLTLSDLLSHRNDAFAAARGTRDLGSSPPSSLHEMNMTHKIVGPRLHGERVSQRGVEDAAWESEALFS